MPSGVPSPLSKRRKLLPGSGPSAELGATLEEKQAIRKEKARLRGLANLERWRQSNQHKWMAEMMSRAGERATCIWEGDFGKAVFPVVVNTAQESGGQDVAVCVCDIYKDENGNPVRKPTFRMAKGRTGPKRLSFYEQALIALPLVPRVVQALDKISGAEETKEERKIVMELPETKEEPGAAEDDLDERMKRFVF